MPTSTRSSLDAVSTNSTVTTAGLTSPSMVPNAQSTTSLSHSLTTGRTSSATIPSTQTTTSISHTSSTSSLSSSTFSSTISENQEPGNSFHSISTSSLSSSTDSNNSTIEVEPAKPGNNTNLARGLEVGLGVAAAIIIIIIIATFCWKRRNTKKKENRRTAINMAAMQRNPNESEVPYNSRPRSIQTYLSIDDFNTNSLQYNRIDDHYGTSAQGYQTVDTRSRNSHQYATALPTGVASASGWYLHVISTAQANGLPYYNSADSSESANRSQNPSIYRSMSHERVRPSDGASELSNGASQRSGRATQRSGGASQRSGGASQRSGRASVRSNLFLDSSTLYQTIDSKLKAPSVEIVDQE